ncbi:neutral zinc metallopeptidase, partial [Kribbella sp.]|uniref:neutral zinc metallopeptidase n=1 Tax=Kribbella sp. TaxID=1871183 RepID=UPI002D25769D
MKRVIALCAAVALLAGCASESSATDADRALASEVAKARAGVSTTPETPGGDSTAPVSEPPMPKTLAASPIYRIGKLPASGCAEPAYPATSLANVRAYFTQYLGCLNKAWAPAIRKAGFTFRPPKLVVVLGRSPSSPCDFADGRDYYCGDTIYMDASTHIKFYQEDPAQARAWMAFAIGHEYGHHVQVLAGILSALYERDRTLNGVDVQLEDSRRTELQASCLSAVYLGADRNDFPLTPDRQDAWSLVTRNTV